MRFACLVFHKVWLCAGGTCNLLARISCSASGSRVIVSVISRYVHHLHCNVEPSLNESSQTQNGVLLWAFQMLTSWQWFSQVSETLVIFLWTVSTTASVCWADEIYQLQDGMSIPVLQCLQISIFTPVAFTCAHLWCTKAVCLLLELK